MSDGRQGVESDADGDADRLSGINRVAAELGVTPRAIRFYEDKGLIQPQRAGSTRVYTRREVARMRLILRGKRLGFSLKEIKAFSISTPSIRSSRSRCATCSTASATAAAP